MKVPLAGTSGIQNNTSTLGSLDLGLLKVQGATEKKKNKTKGKTIIMEKEEETEGKSKREEAKGLLQFQHVSVIHKA